MSFGELSPDPVETADGFMVGGAIMAPPMWNRVNAEMDFLIINVVPC